MAETRTRPIGVTKRPWASLAAGIGVGAAVAAAVALFGPDGEEKLWSAVRATGRTSFLLFLVPLLARPLDILVGGAFSRTLLAWRGNFGLALAGNHLVHLLLIVALYDASATPPVSEAVRWGGLLVSAELAAMAVLTFQAPVRRVGPRVTAIVHRVTLHGLIYVFLYDLVLKDPIGTYPLLSSMWLAAVSVRFAAWVVEWRRTPSAAVAADGAATS